MSFDYPSSLGWAISYTKDCFTHKPRAVRGQLKRSKCVQRHFQNHVVWTRAYKCSVKSYVTKGPQQILFMQGHHTLLYIINE